MVDAPVAIAYAYRPPSLFASQMRAAGHEVHALICDEDLVASKLDGNPDRLQDGLEIFYVMTHGNFDRQGYQVELNSTQWRPPISGLATLVSSTLSIAIFDTCHLIDSTQNWQALWGKNLGKSLRLILGFEGTVAIDQGAALRGGAFAKELLAGKSFADAWLLAADASIDYDPEYKLAVAIGIGDSAQDAQAILASASLASMPPARQGPTAHFALKR